MQIFLLLVIIVILIIIISKQNKSFLNFQIEIRKLSIIIDDLKNELERKLKSESIKAIQKEESIKESFSSEVKLDLKAKEEVIVDNDIKESINLVQHDIESNEIKENKKVEYSESLISNEIPDYVQEFPIKKSWIQNFKEKNPDIEKFIGENLISKIGILILVLGISFFVNYAIDKDWINEPTRVGIGILAGGIIMAIAHKLRKKFSAFSSVFVAGAVSVFYFTIGIAFHDYHLFSQTIAFIIMVIITIFSALVSVSYNRRELAVLTLIAGFAVPFMVSTGEGNFQILFTYILVLNIGMLIISYFKKWNIVTFLAFIFTSIIYGSWFFIEFNNHKLPYIGALIFGTLNYIVFSISVVVNNVRNKGIFTKIEYIIMLFNTFFYFAIGAIIFQNKYPDLKGIFTISLAIYNLLFSIVLYKKFSVKKDSIYFLLGLALTFITITIPFQFNGNFITLFWACEAVLLLWFSQKSKMSIFKIGTIIVQILMIISLFLDWNQAYGYSNTDLFPVLNKIFITGIVAIGSLVLTYMLLRKETEPIKFYFFKLNQQSYKNSVLVASIIIGYFVGLFEIIYQVNKYYTNTASTLSYAISYHYIFSTILIFFLFKKKKGVNNIIALIIISFNILMYILIFNKLTYLEIKNNLFFNYDSNSAFINHYIVLISLLYSFYALVKNRNKSSISKILNNKIMLWIFVFCITFVLSNEIMVHSLISSVENIKSIILNQNQIEASTETSRYSTNLLFDSELSAIKKRVIKIGFPILWGLLSFVFLIIGIKKHIKQLRIIALSLLGLTVLKLFIFDINVSGPGRIVAFILLGILILIISFAYQKLNKKANDESEIKNKQDEKNN